MTFDKKSFQDGVKDFLRNEYDISPSEAEPWQVHNAVARTVMGDISDDMKKSRNAHLKARRACYFSAEFLVGRAVYNNLMCLGVAEDVEHALREMGLSLYMLEDIEDAALGNGGLGRLAACFLDSAATLDLPLDGYGIRYKYGLFKQNIDNGFQVEEADDWTEHGDMWSKRNNGDIVTIHFADQVVNAVPYDMPIIGYGTKNIGTLRLWQSEPIHPFDFRLFNEQRYDEAVREKNRAEDISRALYPNDDTREGKILRLKQQYFFCCASITDIIKKYKKTHGEDLHGLADFITIQLNDTHPVISIPELIRQLMDVEGMSFHDALAIAKKVFNYTNHTIMAEALEKWAADLILSVVPRIYDIIIMINEAFKAELQERHVDYGHIASMEIVVYGVVHMARLAIYVSSYTNGVARIHTEILKHSALNDWYAQWPDRFQNKTNGITQRRWLALCNKELTDLNAELLGSRKFITNLDELKKLVPYADDKKVLERFMEIKRGKKAELAEFIKKNDGVEINPDTIFDIQIKRLHEYKRQLLNAFSVLYIYFGIKDGTIKDFYPTTFIFGAKSAPGYRRAKGIIKFINEIARLVNNDPDTKDILKVVFVKNYNVSAAEYLVAGADVSAQISTAGTEASGTGNMKFMLNGTVTLGTYDGANVEIVEEAGMENNYIFGARVEELEKIKPEYNPLSIYESNPRLKRVIDTLVDGTFSDGGDGVFGEIHSSLLYGSYHHKPDHYYLLGDFQSFVEARLKVNEDYKDREAFSKKCFINMCMSGKFSSDRTIKDYAKNIWKINPIEIDW